MTRGKTRGDRATHGIPHEGEARRDLQALQQLLELPHEEIAVLHTARTVRKAAAVEIVDQHPETHRAKALRDRHPDIGWRGQPVNTNDDRPVIGTQPAIMRDPA